MLNNPPFYFKILRKYITVFGSMFDTIDIVRTAFNSQQELQRVKVPLIYGPKDKMVTRLKSDPDTLKGINIVLPRLSFELKDVTYDKDRKQNSLLRVAKGDSAYNVNSQYMGVPYDLTFELALYAKTIDDGNQVIEQILPYFNPDYTMTITPIPELGFLKDVPIILNSVEPNVEYEGNQDQVRYVYWTLNFTLKGYFFGPISKPKIIRKVITNIFNDVTLQTNELKLNLANGNNGSFKTGDAVFNGYRVETAKAIGYVTDWNPDLQKLHINGVQGTFTINTAIRAASSNAVYTIDSFDVSPGLLATMNITPDPYDAEPDSDYGYTISLKEEPDSGYTNVNWTSSSSNTA